MSDQQKPELVHERVVYGCNLKHSHENDYAVLTDPDGKEHIFVDDPGMIAQGAPSATLLAIHAAKRDQAARAQDKIEEAKAKRYAAMKPVVVDSPIENEATESEGEA